MADNTDFTITVLGSGTLDVSLERSSSSVLIEICGKKILVDSGPGTMRRLLECGVHINDLDIILYTHLHPDHTSELIPILFSTKYGKKRERKLSIYASKGFIEFFKKLNSAYSNWLDPGDLLEIVELIPNDFVDKRSFKIRSSPVKHHSSSIAFRIEYESRSITLSGDTDYCTDIVKLADKSDLFICECSHPDHLKAEGHLSPSFAGRIAKEAGVKKLLLLHFYPSCEEVDIEKELRKTYSGELILGKDLLRLTL